MPKIIPQKRPEKISKIKETPKEVTKENHIEIQKEIPS